jgi:Tfp pilus assembly protein PilW
MMVAMFISGILVMAVFQALRSQAVFSRYESAREEVQQNARSALDLIAADLRMVGGNGAITAMSGVSITAEVPRAWGIVCGALGGNLTAVYFMPGSLTPSAMAMGRGFSPGLDNAPGSQGSVLLEDRTAQGANLANGLTRCQATLNPAGNPAPVPIDGSWVRVYRATGATTLAPQAFLYLSEQVTYDVDDVTGLDGKWIRRNGQAFAGPVAEAGGLTFAYQDRVGNTAVLPDQISTIEVQVNTQSTKPINQHTQEMSASTVVAIRNREIGP